MIEKDKSKKESDEKSKTINGAPQLEKKDEKSKTINDAPQLEKKVEKSTTINDAPKLDKKEFKHQQKVDIESDNNTNKIIGKNILAKESEEKRKNKRKEWDSTKIKNGEPINKLKKIIKNKLFITTISSLLLGVSAITIGTVIPVMLLDRQSIISVDYAELIKNYNLKSLTEKIANYNKMVNSNNKTILEYFFNNPMNVNKKTGLYHWVSNNLDISENLTIGNDFINFLSNIWTDNISSIANIESVNNTTFNNFLFAFNEGAATNTQSTDINKYLTMGAKIGTSSFGIKSVNMYSTFIEYIEDINIDNRLTMNITFKPNILNKNLPFKVINIDNVASTFKYKSVISINDITLFPGATQYIKKTILGVN